MTVTPEHKFFVRQGATWQVKEAESLSAGDLLPVPLSLPEGGHAKEVDVKEFLSRTVGSHPYWKERLFTSFDGKRISVGNRKAITLPARIPVGDALMRFLGYYVAEGCVHFRHKQEREDIQLVLSFGLHEEKTLALDCARCCLDAFGIEPEVKRRPSRSEVILRLPNAVALLVRALGAGDRARQKRVPDLVFNAAPGMRKAFLSAYTAGDGHHEKKARRYRCVTSSGELASGLIYLLASLGKSGSVIRRRAHKFNNYRERLSGQVYAVTYLEEGRESQKYGKLGQLLLVPVKEVIRVEEESGVVDIEVEGNHSFLAGDAVFTHNCHSPNREAFDLYSHRMKGRSTPSKALYWGCIQAYRLLENDTVPKIEHIFANSANTRARIKRYLRRDSEILHPGVDAHDFSCESFDRFFFYPSRITPEKRFEYAIDAFREFKARNKERADWKLVIAGSLFADRPDHAAYYERMKRYLGSDGRIVIDASADELSALYAKCYCVLYAPINEDFGIVPLEALASSKPVISVNEGGPREVVREGVDGFLVNSPKEMSLRMEYLAERPERAEEMGREGRRNVEARFTWKSFLERFGKACERVKRNAADGSPAAREGGKP
jgi:glycosyltransferase involved in cell wall biosynthesis